MSGPMVEVWWARPGPSAELEWLLDESERERLVRLRREVDRHRFLVAHALLRLVLSSSTGARPAELVFQATCRSCGGPHGKPHPVGWPEQHVSLTHAGDRVVVARTTAGPVGVDVEPLAELEPDGFDRVALAAVERAVLAETNPVFRGAARLTYWVRKEAVLKATGHGLLVPPNEVIVSPPADPPRLLDWTASDPPQSPVFMTDLALGAEHLGCVAVLTPDPPEVVVRDASGLLASSSSPAVRIRRTGTPATP